MANTLKMAQISTIRTLWQRGRSKRAIARELDIDRRTVSRYVEDQEGSKCTKVRTGKRSRHSQCEPYREQIEQKLDAGLTAQRIFQDLRVETDYGGAYDSVQRFVCKLKGEDPRRVWRMECAPGEEVQVDFGTVYMPIGEGGRRRKVHIFRVVLSHSRKGYSEAVLRQDNESFIRCLENAFRYFGGVPRQVCVDNLKAAVIRADWYDPQIHPKLASFACHYGTLIMPTRPYRPEHKGKVERGVGYVKDNALKGHDLGSLAAINEQLWWWELHIADQRIHGTTKKQVGEHFLQSERGALAPLPESLFPCFEEGTRRVHRDSYIEVKGAYYEVPEEHIGRAVWVRWDGREVRIFTLKMDKIRMYGRLQPGQFTRTLGVQGHRESVEKTIGWYYRRVRSMGSQCARWADGLIEQRPERAVRVMQGLLNLNRKHTRQRLDKACGQAMQNGSYRLQAVRDALQPGAVQDSFHYLEEHEIIRPLELYDQFLEAVSSTQPKKGEKP